MLKIKIVFLFLLVLLNSISCKQKTDTDNLIVHKKHPLSIDSMKNKEFPKGKIVIENLVKDEKQYKGYKAYYYADNLKIYLLVNIPKSEKPEKGYPVIIVNHGHIPPEKYSTVNSYKNTSAFFASKGFIVLKPDYRGHGQSDKSDNQILDRLSYTLDVLYLINSIESLDNADTDNIFMYGHSMGGNVTLAVLEATDKVKAATLWAPVCVEYPESTLYFRRKHGPDEAEELSKELDEIFSKTDYKEISAINYISYIQAPVILHHGTKDQSVPYEWSENLEQEFIKNNIEYKFYTYENDNHNISANFFTVLQRDVDFFKKYMK